MRDHPRSPRQGSPVPQPPRLLSDELGDLMSSSDDYAEDDESVDEEEEEEDEDLETPMSSRKGSQSDGFFDNEESYDPFKPLPPIKKVARIHYDSGDEGTSRPATATSPPPFRRSSTCPVLTPDFLSSAADEVVRIMPDQADFMKRMVEGWREIQRRSSVSVLAAPPTGPVEGVAGALAPPVKRPHTAPSPMLPPPMNFSSFPRISEREEDQEMMEEVEEEADEDEDQEVDGCPTDSETSCGGEADGLERVESTLDELRVLAKQQAEAAIVARSGSAAEQDARFAVVNKCIDSINSVYDRKPNRGRRRRRVGVRCVRALVRICEMFASEGADGGSYRFESRFLGDGASEEDEEEEEGGENEDYADDEAEDDDASLRLGGVARAWCEAQREFDEDLTTVCDSGDYLGGVTAVGTEKTLSLPSPIKDPYDDRRHAELVRQARSELDTLLSEAAGPETPFEERHSRVVYAVEAYLARLSEMEATHDREFRWHSELKAFHVAMGSRNLLGQEPGTGMALVGSLSCCFIPIAMVLWYATEPTTTWMLWRIFIPIGCYFLLLAGFYIDQKQARDALYEEMLPLEAREMRRRHKRERELLHAAHDRAVQKVYSP